MCGNRNTKGQIRNAQNSHASPSLITSRTPIQRSKTVKPKLESKTDLIEAVGASENRTVEETGRRDDGQVQHIVSDGNTRSGLRIRFALENAVRQVLNRKV